MNVVLRENLSMCFSYVPPGGQHTIGLINVQNRRNDTEDTLHFYVRAQSDKRYVLRMINSASKVKILLKRDELITSDEFDECVRSRVFELATMVPFLSPPVRTITEQYPGFMYQAKKQLERF